MREMTEGETEGESEREGEIDPDDRWLSVADANKGRARRRKDEKRRALSQP